LKIEFKFNSKSSGLNIPEAISIAKQCEGIIENKVYKIEFESPKDKNLRRLCELIGNLKGTTISVDDEESVSANKFYSIINCPDRYFCNGVCRHYRIGDYYLDEFKDSESIEENILYTDNERLIKSLTRFLVLREENQFRFNKTLFLEQFKEGTLMESKICSEYNLRKIKREINLLPDFIQLLSLLEYNERFGVTIKVNIANEVNVILRDCEINSKLTLSEILKCSQILSLIHGDSSTNIIRGVTIEGTNIIIYSFPLVRKFVLAKLLLNQENSKINELYETSNEDEEPRYIIEKKNEFFYLYTPYYEVFFQIFDEDDSTLKESFEKLKSI